MAKQTTRERELEALVARHEERIARLEALVAGEGELPAPGEQWRADYKLPDDAITPRRPSPESGVVLQCPLVVEDPTITDADIRALMAARLDVGQWREGPASQGWRYWGGNYKIWGPNGIMLSAISDTVDIMMAIIPVNPTTGELMPYPTKGTIHGRIYDSFWMKTDRGWVISARTAEIQVLKNAIRIVVTDDEADHPSQPIVQFNEPEQLNSGRTGWHLGVIDTDGEPGYRMVRLCRLSSMIDAEALNPDYAGVYVMFVDPAGD